MAIRLRKPSVARLAELLEEAAAADLSYSPVGIIFTPETPTGWKRHRREATLGHDRFEQARDALATWAVHRGAGLTVRAEDRVSVGTNVAMTTRVAGLHMEITCRVVTVVDELDRWGFAYGTLPVHPERGEEAFVLSRADGAVTFTVEAVSQPAHPLAVLARPLADRLQLAATSRYLNAMRAAT